MIKDALFWVSYGAGLLMILGGLLIMGSIIVGWFQQDIDKTRNIIDKCFIGDREVICSDYPRSYFQENYVVRYHERSCPSYESGNWTIQDCQ